MIFDCKLVIFAVPREIEDTRKQRCAVGGAEGFRKRCQQVLELKSGDAIVTTTFDQICSGLANIHLSK